MNEAFNQICTWFAPKNKVFSGSCSLSNRIAFAVGINSLGTEAFFKRLLKSLGIPLTNNVAYYLHKKEVARTKRLSKCKTREAKIEKNKRKYDKLVEHTRTAKMELHKRQGTYRRGMNLDDPIGDAVEEGPTNKKSSRGKYCEYCGAKGHLTQRSGKCTAKGSTVKKFDASTGLPTVGQAANGSTVDAEDVEALRDCDRMDSIPFDADYESEPEQIASLATMLLEDYVDGDDSTSEGLQVGSL
jgi:hypothetical protein